MTKRTFTYALDKLDPSYISESLCYTEKKIKVQNGWGTAIKIIAIAICLAFVFAGIISIALYSTKTPGNIIDLSLETTQNLVISENSKVEVDTGESTVIEKPTENSFGGGGIELTTHTETIGVIEETTIISTTVEEITEQATTSSEETTTDTTPEETTTDTTQEETTTETTILEDLTKLNKYFSSHPYYYNKEVYN